MNRTAPDWRAAIAKIKPGLTIAQAAKALGVGYGYAHSKLKGVYRFTRQPRTTDHSQDKIKPNRIDWSQNNAAIAKKYGVSREWVRRKRIKASMVNVNGGNA